TRSKRDWSSDVCSSDLIWTTPDGPAFDATLEHAEHGGSFLRSYFPFRRFENGGGLVRDKSGGPGNRRSNGAATHFHPPGIRGFRSEERRVGKECRDGLA